MCFLEVCFFRGFSVRLCGLCEADYSAIWQLPVDSSLVGMVNLSKDVLGDNRHSLHYGESGTCIRIPCVKHCVIALQCVFFAICLLPEEGKVVI